MKGFIQINEGLFFKESDGTPWSSKRSRWGTDGALKRLTSKSEGYYLVRVEGKTKKWHRVLFEYFKGPIPEGLDVDHINNIRDDNRIENLQLKTNKDNCRSRLKQKNNTSGHPGVSWNKSSKKWMAHIGINGKRKYLGYFTNPEEAAQTYLKAKIKFHGKDSIRF